MSIEQHFMYLNHTMLDAIRLLATLKQKIALIVDSSHKQLGTIVDGDVRRALLKGISLDVPVTEIMFTAPTTLAVERPWPDMRALFERDILYAPVIDDKYQVVGLEATSKVCTATQSYPNAVIIVAGGLGTRLGALTQHCPKPMLCVQNKPILEYI